MGIIQRFSDIMRSNINAALDKVEDPAKLVDQYLIDLRKDLADVKKETAGVMASEKQAQRAVDNCKEEIAKYTNAAKAAVQAGNDEDAKTLLSKKQSYDQQLGGLEQALAQAKANSEKMQQMYTKLTNDISSLEARKASIKAKVATAKATERVNKMTSGTDRASASMDAFDRMEAKANARLDAATAETDLSGMANSDEDLAAKYLSGSASKSVEDELAALKAEMGGSGSAE